MQDNEHSSVMKSCRILCKNIVLLRSELDKCICIPNVYSECMLELRVTRSVILFFSKNPIIIHIYSTVAGILLQNFIFMTNNF